MSIADAINGAEPDQAASGVVGRQVFVNGIVATVTGVEGDMAHTDRAGVVEVAAVRRCLLPRVGDVVVMYGLPVVWLETDVSARTPKGLVLEGETVIEMTPGLGALRLTGERWEPQVCQVLARLHNEHRAWRERLNRDANELADRLDLCSRYDEFMKEHGLTPRQREYAADITIRLRGYIHGTDFVDARESMTPAVVRSMVEGLGEDLEWDTDDPETCGAL